MISNLNSARELIQADLDHAQRVLQLWQDQVAELERALGQLDAVDASRTALRVEYQGQQGGAAMPGVDGAAGKAGPSGKRRGRPPTRGGAQATAAQKAVSTRGPRKQHKSAAGLEAGPGGTGDTPRPGRRGPGKKQKASAVKYHDTASGKTWSGRGRKPSWLSGDADQYLVSNLRSRSGNNPDAAAPAG